MWPTGHPGLGQYSYEQYKDTLKKEGTVLSFLEHPVVKGNEYQNFYWKSIIPHIRHLGIYFLCFVAPFFKEIYLIKQLTVIRKAICHIPYFLE